MKKLLSIFFLLFLVSFITACEAPFRNNPITATTVSSTANTPKPTASPIPSDGMKSDGKIHVYLLGEGELINTPDSSFINYLVYYSTSKHLIICMNGKEYVFSNISPALWSDFKSATSVGDFYNNNIRGNTAFHINDYDGSNGDLIVLDHVD